MNRYLLIGLIVVTVLAGAGQAHAQPYTVLADDFSNGVIDPHWGITNVVCSGWSETGGQFVLNRNTGCTGSVSAATDPFTHPIKGDFTVEIDYELLSFNIAGVFRTAAAYVRTNDMSRTAVIERYNRQAGDATVPNVFNYKTWYDDSNNSAPGTVWHNTTHSAGKFRFRRVGTILESAYWSGGAWVTMKSAPFSTGDVHFGMFSGSGVTTAGWSTRWDNLLVRASEEPTPPAVCHTDDFDDGVIAPELQVFPGCSSVVESGGVLRLTQGSCNFGSSVRSRKNQIRLCGDFDIQVDLRKVTMGTPTAGSTFAGLQVGDTNYVSVAKLATIEFYNRFAAGDCATTSNLKSWVSNPANCSSTIRSISGTSVRLRLQRVGSTIRTYTRGTTAWILERASTYTTEPLLFALFAGTDANGQSLAVEFDNLSIQCSTEDAGAPVLAIPPDASHACPADVPPLSIADASAIAPHGNGVVTITAEEIFGGGIGSAVDPIEIRRTFTATDLCNHSVRATQTILVADGVAPALEAPPAIAITPGPGVGGCATTLSLVDLGAATASDNCGSPTIALSGVPEGNLFPEGETVLTWTATDAAGNATTATQTVNIACPRGRVAGEVVRACNGTTEPVEGIAVELLHAGDVIATTATGPTGEFAFDEVRLASYTVRVGVLAGYAVDIDTRLISLETGAVTLALEPFTFTCLLSDLTGTVTATCNAATTPAAGATVDLYREDEMGQQVLVATTSTDLAGAYQFSDLALGTYEISIVTPLGYVATPAAQEVVLATPDGLVAAQAIELGCQPIAAEPRSMGYWKHQVNVYLTGKGHAQESLVDLLSYIDLIVERFNENPLHPVALYDAGASGTGDRLRELQRLLTVNRGGTGNDRARQQLLALLLNVVSLKIAQSEVISADGAIVSQAITYCYDLVADGNAANDEAAKDIAETIVTGGQVVAGAIPLTTATIAYRDRGTIAPASPALEFAFRGAWPNPARGTVRLAFTLDSNEPVRVEVFDVVGRRVLDRTWRDLGVGVQAVALPGGEALRAGVYTVRLTHGERTQSARFVRVE